MKKAIALILAMAMAMLMGCAGAACAESEPSREDLAKTIAEWSTGLIKDLIKIYRETPEKFDDSHAYMLYWYYKLNEAGSGLEMAEIIYSVPTLLEPMKGAELGRVKIEKTIDDAYADWLSGKITLKEFCDKLIVYAEIVTAQAET